MHICNDCFKSYRQRQSLSRHKKSCKGSARTIDSSCNSSSLVHPERMRVFRTPTSVGRKRSTLATLIDQVGKEEAKKEKLKNSFKRQRRMTPTMENSVCNDANSETSDLGELGYETDTEASNDSVYSEMDNKAMGSDGLVHTNLINSDSDDESNDSSLEDSDEQNEDVEKVWRLIAHRSCVKNCDALSSFKFFVKLCQTLKQDQTLRMIMKTIKNARDKYGMKFKEAVDYAVNKKKHTIYNIGELMCEIDSGDETNNNEKLNHTDEDTTDSDSDDNDSIGSESDSDDNDSIDSESDSDDNDSTGSESDSDDSSDESDSEHSDDSDSESTDNGEIWKELYDDAVKFNVDILEIVASYIRLCQTLKHDAVYESVMETVEYAIDIDKEKNFDDALDFAVQKRKFLILQAFGKAKMEACKEGKQWSIASTEDEQ